MPVYNVREYLKATLDCVLEQTYSNWELYLVDDGSTDGSQDIAKEYAQKDGRVTFIQRETLPKGAPACRAIGMGHIKGDYLIHLDSDDLIAPYCFQQRIEYMELHPHCDFAVFPMMSFYNHFFDAKGMVFGYKYDGDAIYDILARSLPFVVATNIYRLSTFNKDIVRWDTSLNIYLDADYNLQCLHAGMKYEISNGLPDYFYRLSAQNSVCKKTTTASRCESQVRYMEKQIKLFGDNQSYKKAFMICAAQVYRNILNAPDNKEVLEKFLNLSIFKSKVLLKLNLKFIRTIGLLWPNEKVYNFLQLILCPTFILRFNLYFRRKTMRKNILSLELENRFNVEVDKQIRILIEEKI